MAVGDGNVYIEQGTVNLNASGEQTIVLNGSLHGTSRPPIISLTPSGTLGNTNVFIKSITLSGGSWNVVINSSSPEPHSGIFVNYRVLSDLG